MSFIMRNRRVNVYKNTNLNQVVTDYRAGTPLKNVNTQQAYKNITPNVIPGGHTKKGDAKVPLAGTRISRVRAAPIGGYRKTLATGTGDDGKPICCAKNGNKNGFTQEIYKDTWALCNTVEVYVLVISQEMLLDQHALRNHLLGQECSIMLLLLQIICEILMRQRKNMLLVTVNIRRIFVVCLTKEVRKNIKHLKW